MLGIIGKILFKILLLPVKLVVVLIEFALTIIVTLLSAAGELVSNITGICTFIVIVGAICGIITGGYDKMEFWKCVGIGFAFTAVPAVIVAVGVEGITMLKELLYNVLYL